MIKQLMTNVVFDGHKFNIVNDKLVIDESNIKAYLTASVRGQIGDFMLFHKVGLDYKVDPSQYF